MTKWLDQKKSLVASKVIIRKSEIAKRSNVIGMFLSPEKSFEGLAKLFRQEVEVSRQLQQLLSPEAFLHDYICQLPDATSFS